MREFVEQPLDSWNRGDRLFERGEMVATFATDGTVYIASDWENGFGFKDRAEFEAFVRLAQTMPFPEE